MLKKTITYENFNEETVTEDHYFHLSKADLIELEMSADEGMEARLTKISKSGSNREIFEEFKRLLLLSYGKRSEDGRRFIKTQEICDEFTSSEAFSTLLMELLEDENAAITFVRGIIPAGLINDLPITSEPSEIAQTKDPVVAVTPRTLTRTEMFEMDQDELKSGIATGRYLIGA